MVSPASDCPEPRGRGPRFEFRLSEEERAALYAKALAAGMTPSELLRALIVKVRIRHRQDERKRLALLNRVNANLNMIARWVNTHKGEADAAIVTGQLRAVEREITRLLAALERQ
jgi:IS5 family transposase